MQTTGLESVKLSYIPPTLDSALAPSTMTGHLNMAPDEIDDYVSSNLHF